MWQVFGAIRKLGNFGQGYVNFGEPITLQNFLNERAPNWRAELADDRAETKLVNASGKRAG